ncbi:MAG: hypothetical protein VZR08_03970, partial [Anaerovoracaceae bacterium]|nr:hypothetical protein [Anaerovoracaceae bacterium]
MKFKLNRNKKRYAEDLVQGPIYDTYENYDESKPSIDYAVLPDREKEAQPILETKGVGIDFGGLTAVDEFTITVSPTEIAVIIGHNGAGKN